MTAVNHLELLDELSNYLDDQTSAEVRTEIEKHLVECENCRIVVDTLRKTVELYRRLPAPALPESAREQLYKCLDLADYVQRR